MSSREIKTNIHTVKQQKKQWVRPTGVNISQVPAPGNEGTWCQPDPSWDDSNDLICHHQEKSQRIPSATESV